MERNPRKKLNQNTTKPTSTPKYQVFVSHATADKWLAKVICEKIEAVGASTFRDDRDINGGDDIPEEIRQQIKHSQEFLVLLTPASVGRQWVLLEVGAAWGWRKGFRIVAILEHVDIDPIPEMIKSKKAVKLNEFDTYLNEVDKRAKS
ncbi:MAG: toll/interleukin-1 receptor domain-containing protein [Planctomycetota bacterium]